MKFLWQRTTLALFFTAFLFAGLASATDLSNDDGFVLAEMIDDGIDVG